MREGSGDVNERGVEDRGGGFDRCLDSDCGLDSDEDCYLVGGCDGNIFGALWDPRSEGYSWDDEICHGRGGVVLDFVGPEPQAQLVLVMVEERVSEWSDDEFGRDGQEECHSILMIDKRLTIMCYLAGDKGDKI